MISLWPFQRRTLNHRVWQPAPSVSVPEPVSTTYVLPKGVKTEDLRLDFQHHLMRTVLGALYIAPITSPRTMLDIATGTARWPLEMARAFPQARVVGFDKDEPGRASALPPNYSFVKGNIFAGLPFPDGSFDFVHQRFMVLALPARQWPFVLGEVRRVTAPNGYIELVEGGGAFTNIGPHTQNLLNWWNIASKVNGMDVSLMARLAPLLTKAGLRNIVAKRYRVAVGSWGGRVGEMLEQDILSALNSIKHFLFQHAHVPAKDFDATLFELSNEWNTCRTGYEYYVYYAQV